MTQRLIKFTISLLINFIAIEEFKKKIVMRVRGSRPSLSFPIYFLTPGEGVVSEAEAGFYDWSSATHVSFSRSINSFYGDVPYL